LGLGYAGRILSHDRMSAQHAGCLFRPKKSAAVAAAMLQQGVMCPDPRQLLGYRGMQSRSARPVVAVMRRPSQSGDGGLSLNKLASLACAAAGGTLTQLTRPAFTTAEDVTAARRQLPRVPCHPRLPERQCDVLLPGRPAQAGADRDAAPGYVLRPIARQYPISDPSPNPVVAASLACMARLLRCQGRCP